MRRPRAPSRSSSWRRPATGPWRNRDFLNLVTWLRSHNDSRPSDAPRVGVYGMDLYSLSDSSKAVVEYLTRVAPQAGARARQRTECFRRYADTPEQYGSDVASGARSSCKKDAVAIGGMSNIRARRRLSIRQPTSRADSPHALCERSMRTKAAQTGINPTR
ncbi:MAG: erythromycin esterase family protein [Acidobacteria bacterium]|nr:erythromycin esterase family protein [Acidobacteriota bacterium]